MAKTRLRAPIGVDHAALVRAMATDTLAALTDAGARVLLVTADAALASAVVDERVQIVPEPPSPPSGENSRARERGLGPARGRDGLTEAITAGLALVPPEDRAAVALADLPCLRAHEVRLVFAAALRAGRANSAVFVADAAGLGTTMLAAARAQLLWPAFGAGSAATHARTAAPVTDRVPGARLDVDTAADLQAALVEGVGAATRAVLG